MQGQIQKIDKIGKTFAKLLLPTAPKVLRQERAVKTVLGPTQSQKKGFDGQDR